MARKARIEFAGACYHVINRGNDRAWVFESEGARQSFLSCLAVSCETLKWRLHAWCVMVNHYHLVVETPAPNLVEGMKWLQSTFANRYNRYRKGSGHVFQGRYRAILLEGNAIGPVCHYIHLNPVRAGLVEAAALQEYADSSFAQLWHPRRRWSFVDYESCLQSAGGLADTPAGRQSYRDYLDWLSADTTEQKRLGFATMSRGWAKGSKEFKKSVLEDGTKTASRRVVEAEAREMREPRWQRALEEALAILGKTESELREARKGEDWKVALARFLRERTLVPHRWIAENLSMGAPSSVQSMVSRHRRLKPGADKVWTRLTHHEKSN